MTVEELEIIITANVEKVLPQIRKAVQQIKQEVSNTNGPIKQVAEKSQGIAQTIKNGVNKVKSSMQGLKKEGKETSAQIEYIKSKIYELNRQLSLADKGHEVGDVLKIEAEIEKLTNQYNKLIGVQKKSNEEGKKQKNITIIAGKGLENLKQYGKTLKLNTKQLIKYIGAMFSLRSAYNLIRSASNSWLNSENKQAKQSRANIDYMIYAIGSVFAPVIQFVTNLVYNLLKAVGMVFKALTGVNIFAKASAKSYSSMANSAKEAEKATRSIADFDEIHNIEENNTSSAGKSGGVNPNIDLSELDIATPKIEKLKNKLKELIEPLKKIDFTNLKQALNDIKEPLKELGLDAWEGLEWAWYNILVPLTKWTIEDLLPNFLQFLASVLTVLGICIEACKPALLWIWNNFLKPICEWTGGIIVDVIEALTQKLNDFSNWASSNQSTIENIATAVLGFFAGIWLYYKVKNLILFLKSLGDAFVLLGTKISIAKVSASLAAIGFGALVASILLIATNWGKMNGIEKTVSILGAIAIAAASAAVAVGALQSAWSLGIAATAIVAGTAAILLSVRNASKRASQDINIPKLATGTNYIPQEGIYHLHEGEAVVPKKYNPANDNSNSSASSGGKVEMVNEIKIGSKTLVRQIVDDLDEEIKRRGFKGIYVR